MNPPRARAGTVPEWGRSLTAQVRAADERIFARQAGSHTPVADSVLPALSRAADRSALWLAIAALMAIVGRDAGRRAAVRGVASIGVASLLANQMFKRLFPRRRPRQGLVPPIRRSRMPDSGSFPSGHSASAVAFALGASGEVPQLAAPLGLLAAAVCWSRVYTGVHYPSDVLAGAAIGFGSAALVAAVTPAPSAKVSAISRAKSTRGRTVAQ